jgi:hypothetical protein
VGVARRSTSEVWIKQGYQVGQNITGCVAFGNKLFSDLGILNGITSTVFWNANGPEGVQSIVFQTNRLAASRICYPSAPKNAPVKSPIATPVGAPVVAAPVAPINTSTTGGDMTIIAIVTVGAIVFIAAAIAVALLIIL